MDNKKENKLNVRQAGGLLLARVLVIFSGIIWVSCEKNDPKPEPEPQPQTVAVSGVTLNKTTLGMKPGDSETLTATVAPENATNKAIVWSSSQSAVATVDNAGKVTTVAPGAATVTVTTADGGKTATCEVKVEAPVVEPKYFAAFKFDGKDYKIADDRTCMFTKHSDTYYVVECSDTVARQALTVSIAQKLEPGQSYDIYAGSIYVTPNIKLLFTAGETVAEESFGTDDITKMGIIGKLTVSELTDKQLSGTFSCRTMHGEITEGKFNVKAREWE